jgi:hypothetical protein
MTGFTVFLAGSINIDLRNISDDAIPDGAWGYITSISEQ